MMDNTPAKKYRKSPKNRHIQPPFSPFFLRKCLTNSGRYILSQGTEENSNTIYSPVHCFQMEFTKTVHNIRGLDFRGCLLLRNQAVRIRLPFLVNYIQFGYKIIIYL